METRQTRMIGNQEFYATNKVVQMNGNEYYATKKVRFDGAVYQEYKSTDPMWPDTAFFDSTGKIVDEKTHRALKEKFDLPPNIVDGKTVIYD